MNNNLLNKIADQLKYKDIINLSYTSKKLLFIKNKTKKFYIITDDTINLLVKYRIKNIYIKDEYHMNIFKNNNSIEKINQNLESITFGFYFNQEFTPNENLKSVTFGNEFNQEFTPNENLESITFGHEFNQEFTPNENLKSITFGNDSKRGFIINKNLKIFIFQN